MDLREQASRSPDAQFWNALAAGEVRLARCTGCRRWIWPVEPRCGECGSLDIVWEPIEPVGTVYSWTRTHYRFVPERPTPFVIVVVEVPSTDGARVIGVLDGDDTDVEIGSPVAGRIAAPSDATHGLHSLVWELVR